MAKFSLRRYDVQAQVSMILSLASVVTLIALAYFVFRRIDMNEFIIYYGKYRRIAVMLAGLVTMGLATAGFGLGLNSAGQRRNEKAQLSWIGFFLGAGVLTLTLILLYIFLTRGELIIQ